MSITRGERKSKFKQSYCTILSIHRTFPMQAAHLNEFFLNEVAEIPHVRRKRVMLDFDSGALVLRWSLKAASFRR
jgi:hypothetical protein